MLPERQGYAHQLFHHTTCTQQKLVGKLLQLGMKRNTKRECSITSPTPALQIG
jgi:hypothetical protein